MITASVDMTGFNAGIAGLQRALGIETRRIVEKEAGELIKTLVRVSPPRDRSRSQFHAETDVRSRFEMAGNGGFRDFNGTSGTVGASGVKWYSVDEKLLRGVLPQNDMTGASVSEVYRTFRQYNKRGRIIKSFTHPRRRQRVSISQRLLVTKKQIAGVVKKVRANFGRLKAGWLVAVNTGVVRISGGRMPPAWVTNHSKSARGRVVENNLSNPQAPFITIANFAKGISSPLATSVARDAVQIRAKAMAANAALFGSGKKKLSQYA